jgi:hypothetical protein
VVVDEEDDDDAEVDGAVDVEAPEVEHQAIGDVDMDVQDDSGENDAMSDVEEEFVEFMPASIYGPPWADYEFNSDEEFDQSIHPPICTLEGEMAKARAQSLSIV